MFDGQRLVVHRHGDKSVPAIEGGLHRESDGESVDGATNQLLGTGLYAGKVQHVTQWHSQPLGIADQSAAHLVGDTGDRDVLLHHVEVEQVGIGELDFAIDEAGDSHRPSGCIDSGRNECGVDAVEVAGRGHQRGDTPNVERHRVGGCRHRRDGFREGGLTARRHGLRRRLGQIPADEPGE